MRKNLVNDWLVFDPAVRRIGENLAEKVPDRDLDAAEHAHHIDVRALRETGRANPNQGRCEIKKSTGIARLKLRFTRAGPSISR
ncbi:MAG: hypothetical protein GY807_13265 [Gammaproteobacteria bacterium]|nr:hypothetical protein [Gammaproteobacteria bacterium]